MNNNIMNVMLSYNDNDGNYTMHAAVTIISLLEKNRKHKIKIYILSPSLLQENIDELKRIVHSYGQEIKFIINNNIVPNELKKIIINGRETMRGPRYRWFFPNVINNVDRILYLDCDVLVIKDISKYYNMDMHGKAIAGYIDIRPDGDWHKKDLDLDYYINSGVLLFDAKKYDVDKINVSKMEEINKKYSKYFRGWDQDKMNLIYKDNFYVTDQGFNYQISNKWFNEGIENATIIHCLQKPRIEGSCITNNFRKIYQQYLNLTKWKGYPPKKANYGYIHHLYNMTYHFMFNFIWYIIGKISGKYHH